ncbi:potassium transporter Kup [Mycolicibacterium obuense]|uniref:Probable potassium transport system protein Kup n=1 Tax=Mycolicibacterium obuense TaxID=1807 RepID=A0A0M2K2H0_9MYCO|nr:KUP/HAK/KT family potassium transporter [Mycolicibacterium obuense]KKF01351.1 potassium transporter Kup [Mycolicibacterium obuense]
MTLTAAASPAERTKRPFSLAITLGALGVVFGDIGTSPIYTLQTVFNPQDPHPVPLTEANIYGVVSTVFWAVMVIVTLTYVLVVMRADNHGEGGIMALITLLRRGSRTRGRRTTLVLAALGLFGAALFFGDSMITPAISVLSAVEGLKVIEPAMESWIIPVTVVIIVGLFAVQRHGTAAVGRFFGPVMVLWFVTIGVCGVGGIVTEPGILAALSPTHAISFLAGNLPIAFFALAAVVLAVTGAEALYADMGHFGRRAITVGWLGLVLPACTLSYFGQGALLLQDPGAARAPFFLLIPEFARIPMVLLATAATLIASQSVITGAFSVVSQAVQLGYLPRLRITHTSSSTIGQIYVSGINWLLMVSVLALVVTFQTSAALAYAFGMAVIGTITITTALFLYLARQQWRWPMSVVIIGGGVLLVIDLFFLAANLTKLVHGAWLPLTIAVIAFVVMTTWQRGRRVVTASRRDIEGPLQAFVAELATRQPPLIRLPGTAVFLNRGDDTTPLALRANIEHNHVLHRNVLIVAVETEPVPRVSAENRLSIRSFTCRTTGIMHITVHAGYMERPDVPAALAALPAFDLSHASYYLSHLELVAGPARNMVWWRKRLFLAMSLMTADAAGYFNLPLERTVIVGSRLQV